MPDNFWSDADILDIYTRRQAIEDGVLVQLSGPGYQGDPWIPAMVAEAGFRYPVAMTATAFCRYVSPLEGDDEKLIVDGRLIAAQRSVGLHIHTRSFPLVLSRSRPISSSIATLTEPLHRRFASQR
jgi:hypothetical protein